MRSASAKGTSSRLTVLATAAAMFRSDPANTPCAVCKRPRLLVTVWSPNLNERICEPTVAIASVTKKTLPLALARNATRKVAGWT